MFLCDTLIYTPLEIAFHIFPLTPEFNQSPLSVLNLYNPDRSYLPKITEQIGKPSFRGRHDREILSCNAAIADASHSCCALD